MFSKNVRPIAPLLDAAMAPLDAKIGLKVVQEIFTAHADAFAPVEHGQAIPLTSLKQPHPPSPPVAGEFKQKLPLVTPVCKVPDVAWKEMSVGSRHGQYLNTSIPWAKVKV